MRVEENCKRERVKWKRRREEWSGCVTDCLLDAYEDKLKSLDCGNSRRRHREEPKDEDEDEGTTDQNPLFSAATK
jgi:uncharacterized protein